MEERVVGLDHELVPGPIERNRNGLDIRGPVEIGPQHDAPVAGRIVDVQGAAKERLGMVEVGHASGRSAIRIDAQGP